MPSPRFALALALTFGLLIALAGCSSDATGPSAPQTPPPYPESRLALLAADSTSFAGVWARYGVLRGAQSAAAARAALLAELASWPNVAEARLAGDGASFTLEFASGAIALLITAEEGRAAAPRPASPPPGATARTAARPAPRGVREAIPCIDCGSLVLPSTHRVHLVCSDPSGAARAAAIRQGFLDLGWAPELIELSLAGDGVDEPFVPADLLEQEPYGLAVILGAGGLVADGAGAEHFVLEGFAGGTAADYGSSLDAATWEQYTDWLAAEQLVMGAAWTPGAAAPELGVWLHADLLASQLQVAPCAMVALLAGNSGGLADLLADGGPGSFSGWDGPVAAADADAALAALIEGMLAGGGRTDEEALDWLLGEDLGTSGGSHFQLADIAGDYQLPGWATVALPAEDFPAGTVSVEIEFSWESCPDYSVVGEGVPGGEIEVTGLLPGEASITTTAFDAGEDAVGHGYDETAVDPGPNSFSAQTCLADLLLAIGVYPDDPAHETSRIHVAIDYLHSNVDDREYDMDPQLPIVPDDLAPGAAIVTTTAYSAQDSVRGVDRSYVSLQCGQTAETEHCYGWLRIVLGDLPPGTESVQVRSATVDIADVAAITLAPLTEGVMTGFTTHTTPVLRAFAFDAAEDELGHTDLPVTIGCGEQEVLINIYGHGIALRADPAFVLANGQSESVITATVRKWQFGDVNEPTGDIVEDIHVEFTTDFGTWVGPVSGYSDAAGEVKAHLVSNEPGPAAVRAHLSESGGESQPVTVTFVDRISLWIDNSAGAVEEGPASAFDISCAELRFFFNGSLIAERLFGAGAGGWGAYLPHWADPGDIVRLEITPRPDLGHCDEPETDYYHPRVGSAWLHTVREPDFTHQGAVQLFAGADPLGASISGQQTVAEIDYGRLGKGGPSSPARVTRRFDPDGRLIVEITALGPRTLVWQPLTRRYE
ncbi:hypothetical protein FJ251_12600 [bacterium]|nr:hypothetical protein [bacterium]